MVKSTINHIIQIMNKINKMNYHNLMTTYPNHGKVKLQLN